MRFPSNRSTAYNNESRKWSDSGVQATLSDKRRSVCNEELGIAYFEAEVLTQTDYYPFGMMMPDRQWSAGAEGYRYGFNGMERDDDTYGKGNALDFGARIYDSRLGRWLSVDAMESKFPFESTYGFVGGNPLFYKDMTGNSKYRVLRHINEEGKVIAEYKVIVDDQDLIPVQVGVKTTLSNGDWTNEYDWYDINEVHTIRIMNDGVHRDEGWKTERGDYRVHTWYKSKLWANILKKENQDEEYMSMGLTGIRWTSSSSGDHVVPANRLTYISSENVDLLLSVIGLSKGAKHGTAQGLVKPIKNVKSFMEKVAASTSALDTYNLIKTVYNEQQPEPNYEYKCPGCGDTTVGPKGHDDLKPVKRENKE